MSMGVQYVRLSADEASLLDSNIISDGRTPTDGFYVLWNENTGFTDQGWQFAGYTTPYDVVTPEAWENDLLDGNLNTSFSTWSSTVSSFDRIDFLYYLKEHHPGCLEE